MLTKQEYHVRLELFEGPLDLLLYLVTKAEVAITEISVSVVTKQYLEYLDLIRELNIDIAGEYLHMAATLIRLKARELLPQEAQAGPQEQEEGIYNREQLIQQLLEYKKFKEAAQSLKVYEAEQFGAFARGASDAPEAEGATTEQGIGNVTIFDLLTAFRRVLTREVPLEAQHLVKDDGARIDDRIEHVLGLLDEGKEVRFESFFDDDRRRIVLVVTFMALLELIKMQEISFRQEDRFGDIYVRRRPPNERQVLAETPEEESEEPAQPPQK